MLIAVIGGEQAAPGTVADAEAVGHAIAAAGHVLICGGRDGVMAAACRGAKRGGGLTIGILPSTDAAEANKWVDIPIATGIGFARNSVIAYTADALIAIGGRWGTLSEIAFAQIAGKPVVGLHTWALGGASDLPDPVHHVADAEAAVARCQELTGGA